jgi:hypothetical protein
VNVEDNTIVTVHEQVETHKDLGNTVSNTIEMDVDNKFSKGNKTNGM